MTTTAEASPQESLNVAHLNAQIAKLISEAGKLQAEQSKFNAEQAKLNAEEIKLRREWRFYPFVAIAALGGTIGAAIVAAGKLFH